MKCDLCEREAILVVYEKILCDYHSKKKIDELFKSESTS